MNKDVELKELIKEKLSECEKNEYSIYDYLKKTPSIFIACVSALVAVITFFAKLMIIISAKQELAFWGIKPEHYCTSNESILFVATTAIIYALLNVLLTMWFLATYDAYWPYK